jgi:hypothetical protein
MDKVRDNKVNYDDPSSQTLRNANLWGHRDIRYASGHVNFKLLVVMWVRYMQN